MSEAPVQEAPHRSRPGLLASHDNSDSTPLGFF